MKQYVLALSFALFLISALAWAQDGYVAQPASLDEMRRCGSFADCTLVWSGCEDAAINKQYINQYKPTTACWQSKEHNPNAVPTCSDGVCVAVAPDEKK